MFCIPYIIVKYIIYIFFCFGCEEHSYFSVLNNLSLAASVLLNRVYAGEIRRYQVIIINVHACSLTLIYPKSGQNRFE